MRLASCLRLLPCTAACLRSTAGPVATARPCRPTTLPLRKQHGGAAHTHYLFLTCTRCLCSAQQKWRYPSLSPISILLSQVQGPEPLRPERSRTKKNILFPPRWEPSRDTSCVVPNTLPTSIRPTSIISASAGLYVSNQYYISLCRPVHVAISIISASVGTGPVLYQPLQASALYQPL